MCSSDLAVNYYDISIDDILVIQDDMDIEIGKFKIKKNSSSGGHNGIKSIIGCLNSNAFSRLKVGISHDKNKDTINFVLGSLSKNEKNLLEENYPIFNEIIDSIIENGVNKTMNKYNS